MYICHLSAEWNYQLLTEEFYLAVWRSAHFSYLPEFYNQMKGLGYIVGMESLDYH